MLITQTWSHWRRHLLDDTLRSRLIVLDGKGCDLEYMYWYTPRTHRYIHTQYIVPCSPLHMSARTMIVDASVVTKYFEHCS